MKEYAVNINGITHTLQLNEADARRYGLDSPPALKEKKATVANKAAAPKNKAK